MHSPLFPVHLSQQLPNSCIIHHFFSLLPSIGLLLHSGYNPPTYTTLPYLPVYRSDHVEVVVVVRHVSVIALHFLSSHLLVSFGQMMVQDPEWHLSTTSPLYLTPFDCSPHHPHRTAPLPSPIEANPMVPSSNPTPCCTSVVNSSAPSHPAQSPLILGQRLYNLASPPQTGQQTPQTVVQPPLLWLVPPSRCYLGAALPLFTPGKTKQTPSTIVGLIDADIGIVPSHHLLSAALLPPPLTSTSPHLSMTFSNRTAST
ncbi:hypothetical protein CSIM01_04800 [Colletotrichum simmondsii]|uniref:Uncharacterized protein n=1 Tax=Colletotrichum simmondsii TaxID=703756 RepID=A0A135TJT4_9PEZI|nr:hypothetical protein CSIM01_04800 [Colletotrichum simmondsii]